MPNGIGGHSAKVSVRREEEENYLVKVGIIGESACSSLCRARHREERSTFRRRTLETASSLSVADGSLFHPAITLGGSQNGFLRRSGSRESIKGDVRHEKYESLRLDPMPPRITQESYRP